MGTVSYNLAGVLMSMQGRYELLEQEFQRNPVDTLILEMSLDTLTRKESYHVEGDMSLLPRLGSAGTKIRYFFQNFRPDEYDDAWSVAFAHGLGDMIFDKSLDGNRGLFPSQPAVSQAVKGLEERLGCKLFLRSARGVSLTEEGEHLYREVSGAILRLEEAEGFQVR